MIYFICNEKDKKQNLFKSQIVFQILKLYGKIGLMVSDCTYFLKIYFLTKMISSIYLKENYSSELYLFFQK